jgi:hypothetical protein
MGSPHVRNMAQVKVKLRIFSLLLDNELNSNYVSEIPNYHLVGCGCGDKRYEYIVVVTLLSVGRRYKVAPLEITK